MHWRSTLAAVLGLTLAAGTTSAAVAQEAQHWPPKQPVIGQPKMEHGCARIEKSLPTLKDWPKVESQLTGDRKDEARIKAILKDMTLAEKVGQMTQPEIGAITAADVTTYGFGSVL